MEGATYTETHHPTHTLVSIPHSCRVETFSPYTFSMMFSRFRLHHVQPVCETVEREVTDSIIPGRWAYIHLPPHGGFRSGQKLSASYATALLRLPAAWCAPYPSSHLFLCVRKHTCSPSAVAHVARKPLVRKSRKAFARGVFNVAVTPDSISGRQEGRRSAERLRVEPYLCSGWMWDSEFRSYVTCADPTSVIYGYSR